MRTLLYLNGRKTTRKALLERIPESTLERLINAAKTQFRDDPLVENDFMVPGGILTIRFE